MLNARQILSQVAYRLRGPILREPANLLTQPAHQQELRSHVATPREAEVGRGHGSEMS